MAHAGPSNVNAAEPKPQCTVQIATYSTKCTRIQKGQISTKTDFRLSVPHA
jgi:hypothetical protein